MDFPVFDLHCDTALALLGKDLCRAGSLRKNELHIDLEKASKLPGYAQCFACFTTSEANNNSDVAPFVVFERELATIHREIERNSDRISQAFGANEIESNREKGMISAILTIEGPAGIDYDPELLEDLYKIGFRITTLGWNEKNPLTGSHLTGGGLTELGKAYVRQAQKVGMLIDVSHISDEGFWDIMEVSTAPIIASHSNSRAVFNHGRNITDDMFMAICKTGGVCGINMYAAFLGNDPDLDTVCDHIFHFQTMDQNCEHISLGGDLDGCSSLAKGINSVADYPKLADRLLLRGMPKDMVYNIFWKNAVEVMKHCCT